jgi:hypothetical protein
LGIDGNDTKKPEGGDWDALSVSPDIKKLFGITK